MACQRERTLNRHRRQAVLLRSLCDGCSTPRGVFENATAGKPCCYSAFYNTRLGNHSEIAGMYVTAISTRNNAT